MNDDDQQNLDFLRGYIMGIRATWEVVEDAPAPWWMYWITHFHTRLYFLLERLHGDATRLHHEAHQESKKNGGPNNG